MSDSSEGRPPPLQRSEAAQVRVFVDADGVRWHVSERLFAPYDRRRGLSLIFASDAAVRRVRDYPAHWHALSDPELLALSWGA